MRLEGNKTNIYVRDQLFNQCKILLLNIPLEELRIYNGIDSIDEATKNLALVYQEKFQEFHNIPPDVEFWGHCSNLQVWYENGYDTRFLHHSLAFSLLKKLYEEGDPLAKRVFKEEIITRLKSNYEPLVNYLHIRGYLEIFSDKEIKEILSFEKYNKNIQDIFKKKLLNRVLIADKLSNKTILTVIGDEWQSIKDLIFKLKIINMLEARKLQSNLHDLVKKGRITKKIFKGKRYWKVKN